MYVLTIAGCLVAALFTALICANAQKIGNYAGLLDRPDSVRKLHQGSVPLIGGLAIILPVALMAVAYLLWVTTEHTLGTAIAAMVCAAIVGVIDDSRGLSARERLLAQAIIVVMACLIEPAFQLHNIRLSLLNMQFSVDPFAILATMFIVIGFVNSANLADGINGQLLGSVAVWSGFILIYAPDERTPFLVLLSSTLVALFYNLRGKLFSGSAGSYALSLFIGMSAISLYRRSNGAFHADLPVYWFWLPVVDCLRLFSWRALNNRSPLSADRCHIHHVLTRLVGSKLALPIYLALLALPGIVAIFRENLGALAVGVCLVAYFSVFGIEKALRTPSPTLHPENA